MLDSGSLTNGAGPPETTGARRLVAEAALPLIRDLPPWLAQHCARTAKLARTLAETHSLDPDYAARLAWLHDVARHWDGPRWLASAERLGIEIDQASAAHPVLLHGPIGAELLRETGAVGDDDAFAAIACHTSLRPNPTPADLTLFLSDKLEPAKLARTAALRPAAELARSDLRAAARAVIEWQLAELDRRSLEVQPLTLLALEELSG